MAGDTPMKVSNGETQHDPQRTFQVVVAATRKMGIGKDGKLPWKLPSDLNFFKEVTLKTSDPSKRNAVIMGRRTWESIPVQNRPLPGRLNVVLTRSGSFDIATAENVVICGSMKSALELLGATPYCLSIEKVFVIGGGQVLKDTLNALACNAIHLTEILTSVECDTFIPPIDLSVFQPWCSSSPMVENGIRYSFVTYVRVRNSEIENLAVENGEATESRINRDKFEAERFSFLPNSIYERHEEFKYLSLVKDIIENGAQKNDRTGTGTLSKFGCQMRFNLRNSFPLLTTKALETGLDPFTRVFWRGVVEELLWFISGSTNAKVSAGNTSTYLDGSSLKSSNGDQMNKMLQSIKPQYGQISPVSDMGSTNARGPHSDAKVYGGKPPINRDGRLSHVDYRDETPEPVELQQRQTSPLRVTTRSTIASSESGSDVKPFNIVKTESGGSVKLNKSILEQNREKRKEIEQSKLTPERKYLRPGMVLLKNCISHQDQVEIIQKCQQLGSGSGGFYRPGYTDGAKLHLHMMCLGKNWDPQTREYEDKRSFDGATPPRIPEEFSKLVFQAIQESHQFLQQRSQSINVEDELPTMSPDICIVNFYSNSGKLGLHQDRDETEKSIAKGLPVVSFSLGDAAEFLYGEGRDIDKAEKVRLESGDVLIFGGKSRLLFHGVPCILPNTAPKRLLDETKLKPGRLNLTFRQYLA